MDEQTGVNTQGGEEDRAFRRVSPPSTWGGKFLQVVACWTVALLRTTMMFGAGAGAGSRKQGSILRIAAGNWIPHSSVNIRGPCFRHPWGSPIHPSVIRGPALPSVGFSFSSFFIRVIRVIRGPFLPSSCSCFCLLRPLLDFKKHKIAQGLDRKLAKC